MMKKLKSFDKGKGICSDIYNDIWCLRLYPNGSRHNEEGDVFMGLASIALPLNVSKMSVQFTVHCHEANIKQTLTNDFDEDKTCWCCKRNTISFSKFLLYNTWTVSVNINILNEFDLNGEEVTMTPIESERNEYSQPQNALNLTTSLLKSFGSV
eukprot:467852_1